MDLISLLSLDYAGSGQHRSILVTKDFTNSGDFVISSLLQHFSRKEPKTPVLLVTMSHDWSNYSASAAKCGFNLRRTQNGGVIEVLNVMSEFYALTKSDSLSSFTPCQLIIDTVSEFIKKHALDCQGDSTGARKINPLIVIIDDLSILLTLGAKPNEIYRLFNCIDKSMRDRSKGLQPNHLSHFIVQTMVPNYGIKQSQSTMNNDMNYLATNIENLCDITLILKPLNTGYSTRVDGTIAIIDNRLASSNKQTKGSPQKSLFAGPSLFSSSQADIGTKRAFFFKLSDRRVRLTSSALIF